MAFVGTGEFKCRRIHRCATSLRGVHGGRCMVRGCNLTVQFVVWNSQVSRLGVSQLGVSVHVMAYMSIAVSSLCGGADSQFC